MNKICPTCSGVGRIPQPMPEGTVMCYNGPNGERWPMTHCNTCGGTGWVFYAASPLVSLDDWNKGRQLSHQFNTTFPKPNGIACPTCSEELVDVDASILTSYPAQKRVRCSKCSYSGLRIV